MPTRLSFQDPLKVWRFQVEIEGFVRFGFSDMTGLERTTESVDYREGGDNSTMQKSAGQTTYSNIVLKRGQLTDLNPGGLDLLLWASQVHQAIGIGIAGEYRRDLTVVQYDPSGFPVLYWQVINAFPVKYKPMGDLNAMEKGGNSIEEMELAHEGFYPMNIALP